MLCGVNPRRLWWGVLAALLSAGAHAKQCHGVDFPERTDAAGTALTLNGLGLRTATILHVSVYVGALYLPQPTHDPAAILDARTPSELILQFVRNVGADDIRESWDKGFAHYPAAARTALADRIARLQDWTEDIKSGERMSFVRLPGRGIQMSVKGALKGTLEGDDFARAFLGIWLGDNPPNPQLKRGLLGESCE
jgi:hypothetical protein